MRADIRRAALLSEAGRTLIEVLVAITIGLMLTVGILSVYGANRQTYRASTGMQRVQAAGQLALDRLAYQIRMAGYGELRGEAVPTASSPTTFTGDAVRVCSGGFVDPVEAGETPACRNDPALPDSLQVRFQVPADAPVKGSSESRDCLGFEVPMVAGFRTAQNRFYVQIRDGIPTLMCAGNGLNPAPLIQNVEDLQISLRVGDPYTRAEQRVDPQGFSDWNRVLGVEVCIQVRSEETGLSVGPQAGVSCRGTAFPDDGRLRRTFTQVVTLRNRIL